MYQGKVLELDLVCNKATKRTLYGLFDPDDADGVSMMFNKHV